MATILVADDEAAVRRVVEAVLSGEGYTILQAADGEEALEVLSREPVDLAIVDLRMPRMNGWTLIRQLRQAGSRVKILAAAGTGEEALAEARAIGADRTTGKPFHVDELRAVVRDLIEQADSGGNCE